jgi:hypothetical protein
MPQLLRDTVQGDLRLVEAKEKKRPGVLAVVEGTFFVADKPSRNGRIYPKELWENVLSSSDLKRMLQNRLLFGTVGHVEEQLDDLIREGKVSHVVTDLKVMSDGRGWGKAEILDTPVGRVLKTLLESGSKLSVSSKAYGEYDGQTGEGHWRVSPSSFILERFDFVVDPGFLEAQPKVKEVYESVIKGYCDKDVVGKLVEEKSRQEKRIVELLKELEEKDKRLKELEEKVEKFAGLRNGLLEKEIESIGDLIVERLGVKEEDISADTVLGVVRKIRKVLEEKLMEAREIEPRETEPGEEIEFEIDEECPLPEVKMHVVSALRRLRIPARIKNDSYEREGDEFYYIGDVVEVNTGEVIGTVYVTGKFYSEETWKGQPIVYLRFGILTVT